MSEEKILDAIEEEKEQKVVEKKKFSFNGFFKDRKNIFALAAVVLGLLAIVLYLLLPAVVITLTDEGKVIAQKNAETIPEMSNYYESITGARLVFGIGSYEVWKNVETSAVKEVQNLVFNIPVLVGLVSILAGIVCIVVMTLLNKSNIVNKVILGLMIVGSIMLLLSAVWFYAVDPITASTRYDTTATIYPYGSINGHGGAGVIIASLLGIAGSVFSGLLIPKPVETR